MANSFERLHGFARHSLKLLETPALYVTGTPSARNNGYEKL